VDDEDFDLLAYLRNEDEQRDSAGFKRKVIGVSWSKLNVQGNGGMKVRFSFLFTVSAILTRFSPAAPHPHLPRRCQGSLPLASHQVLEGYQVGTFQGHSEGPPQRLRRLLEAGRDVSRSWSTWIWVCSLSFLSFSSCTHPSPRRCTTFLKTITNQRFGFLGVNGDVSYGGIPADEMRKRYRGEVVYNQGSSAFVSCFFHLSHAFSPQRTTSTPPPSPSLRLSPLPSLSRLPASFSRA
jgi:ATP-binding cassette subfamily G (WHITE) protein 2 (SNQ2)